MITLRNHEAELFHRPHHLALKSTHHNKIEVFQQGVIRRDKNYYPNYIEQKQQKLKVQTYLPPSTTHTRLLP